MPLSGKLVIGLLQEDNPQKSYFRFKPFYAICADGCQTVETEATYPENGFIRVVPDKNEINHFKARMRKIGALCALDLRKYADQNTKIRPNKNYSSGGEEKNAFIVYSDVVIAPPAQFIAEVVDADALPDEPSAILPAPEPLTPLIALRVGGQIGGFFHWHPSDDAPGCVTITLCPGTCAPEPQMAQSHLIPIVLDDIGARTLLFNLTDLGITEEVARVPIFERKRPPEDKPAAAQTPGADASTDTDHFTTTTDAEQSPDTAQPRPWINHDASIAPQPVHGRLNLRDQAMRAQTGINPRRGRSLSEIIDDQWRKSRIDQLGHPVPGAATGVPALNPVEQAVQSVKDAWRISEAREGLLRSIFGDSSFRDAARGALGAAKGQMDAQLQTELNELEALRLRTLHEIDALNVKKDAAKENLLGELRKTHAHEMETMAARQSAAQREIERLEEKCATAQNAAQQAAQAIDALFGDAFDEKLAESVAQSKAKELLYRSFEREKLRPTGVPKLCDPAPDVLVDELAALLSGVGYALPRAELISLLAALAMGDLIVLSGEPGSGKSALAMQLAAALGLCDKDAPRFARAFALPDDAVSRLAAGDGMTPSIALIEDINASPDDALVEKLIALTEASGQSGFRAILTVQDAPDGRALSPRLLDRACFIRLSPPDESAPWQHEPFTKPAPDFAVSLAALDSAFPFDGEIPSTMEDALKSIRTALARQNWRISRRSLARLRRYCLAALADGKENPMDILDRALAQCVLPSMLCAMDLAALQVLPGIFVKYPRCLALMRQPLPVPPINV